MLLDRIRSFAGASGRGPLAYLLLSMPFVATGCGGCGPNDVQCDDYGNCQICDAYGCHNANPDPTGQGGNGPGSTSASTSSAPTTTTGQGGAGGGPVCDDTVTTCACTQKSDCPSDLYCIEGLCLSGCDHDFECGADKVCANGECVAGCSDTVPCALGYQCVGGGCVPDPTNPECTDASTCEGLQCIGGFCTTPCALNTDCPVGQLCDAGSGACFDDPTPQPLCGGSLTCPGVGQICDADGYCRYPCATVEECKLIDARFVACETVCKTKDEVDPQCDLDHPCPGTQQCISNTCVD